MSRVDELTLFSATYDLGYEKWVGEAGMHGNSIPQSFEIIRRETAGKFPKVVVHYEIDGHDVPREDYLAVLESISRVDRGKR